VIHCQEKSLHDIWPARVVGKRRSLLPTLARAHGSPGRYTSHASKGRCMVQMVAPLCYKSVYHHFGKCKASEQMTLDQQTNL
jgi:hypothetical protein